MRDCIEGPGEIHGQRDSAEWRFGLIETPGNAINQREKSSCGGTKSPETMLSVSKVQMGR